MASLTCCRPCTGGHTMFCECSRSSHPSLPTLLSLCKFSALCIPCFHPHIPWVKQTSEHKHVLFISCRQWGKHCKCIKTWFQTRHKSHPRIHKVQHQLKQMTPIPNANDTHSQCKLNSIFFNRKHTKVKNEMLLWCKKLRCFCVHYVWDRYIEKSHLNINFFKLQKQMVCPSISNA